jgi:hypothetical protein
MDETKKNRNIASAAEMRELTNQAILVVYNRGPIWSSYAGAPFNCHFRWDERSDATIRATELEAEFIRDWVQTQVHTGND